MAFFVDTGAIPSSGIVAVRDYGSSSTLRARLVSAKTAALLGFVGASLVVVIFVGEAIQRG